MITSELFEAYLACPTKCFLKSIGESSKENAYATWIENRKQSYCREGVKRLPPNTLQIVDIRDLKRVRLMAPQCFVLDRAVQAQNLGSSVHAVQLIPPPGAHTSSQIVPIRFVHTNKLSRADRLLIGFDAFVLSNAAGAQVGLAKIIHGDHWSVFKMKTSLVSREVGKVVSKITALLSATSPPEIVLNRHCPECEFQDRCRKRAIEKNDLSLLGLTDKEKAKFNRKGIFTVNQLSYTFRPRRRAKRFAGRSEKYHHSLKALAVREGKTHLVGNVQLQMEGTPVFFDVEGLPDRDFYYLIGLLVGSEPAAQHHTLWATEAEDEQKIWRGLLDILSSINNPVLLHYGSFETSFIKKMSERYGKPTEDSGQKDLETFARSRRRAVRRRVHIFGTTAENH